jgi:predicted hotdog family 3-hydroxylacyl-ACP dehydratase
LPIWAGIEYAAQAAAVHGALVNRRSEPRAGVLAALRNINATCEWLDRISGELTLTATVLHADRSGGIYSFAAHVGEQLLLGGRFTLMFSTELQEDAK